MRFGPNSHKHYVPEVVVDGKMIEILWKLSYGNCVQERPGEIYPPSFALGKRPIADLIDGLKKAYGKIFFMLREEIDSQWLFADGSYVKAHQHASGTRCGEDRAIGRSRGGNTTKIHMCADAHGNPTDFEITGGQIHDANVAPQLIERMGEGDYFIADKGYDSDFIREKAMALGMSPMIPRRKNRMKSNLKFDSHLYKARHLVENLFARLKHFRSIATRVDKLARNFKAFVYIACTFIWLKLK